MSLTREELIAAEQVTLCGFCRDQHFRAYPNQPGYSCNKIPCQCWCTDRDDKPLEVD